MAEAVVDLLKPVEVQQQQGRHAAGASAFSRLGPDSYSIRRLPRPVELVGERQSVAVREEDASRKVTMSRPTASMTVEAARKMAYGCKRCQWSPKTNRVSALRAETTGMLRIAQDGSVTPAGLSFQAGARP